MWAWYMVACKVPGWGEKGRGRLGKGPVPYGMLENTENTEISQQFIQIHWQVLTTQGCR